MRYRVIVSRIQVAERRVRAISEEEAAKQVRTELETPYGFLGSWRTTNTDIDVTEEESPLPTTPSPIGEGDGRLLLSVRDAAQHLGITAAAMYELINTAEIRHIPIGRRKYVSRESLRAFIESHTKLGWAGRDA